VPKWLSLSPSSAALRFIRSVNACSDPEMPSASTMHASLPDSVTIPYSRLATLTFSPEDRNIVEPAAGPCHFDQVSGRTDIIWSSFSSPFLTMSNAT
jgi:hypothetical protein